MPRWERGAVLTVYSANGSPGGSTTAMYLAAQWASAGTEVLLVEADPAGGSLSHNLGIQFTPGSASFVASGVPVRGGNLIDHSQDVLFNNLHVMPSTSSPTGAREIVKWLGDRAGELRDIAESEMAVIVDGGRITADSAAAALTCNAAGVVVVARGDSSPTSLEHIGAVLSSGACGHDVERCVVIIGESPFTENEWREKCDITFSGSIKDSPDVTGDLSAFLNRNKRKSKKWRTSLEDVAEKLLPLAKPPPSDRARPSAGEATAGHAAAEEAAPATPAGAYQPPDPQMYPVDRHAVYYEPPPPEPVQYDAPLPTYRQPPVAHPLQPGYEQAPPPSGYEQQPYPPHDDQAPAYQQQPPAYPPPHESPPEQPLAYDAAPVPHPVAPPPLAQREPQPPLQQVGQPQHPVHQPPDLAEQATQLESGDEPEIAPSGSFRDWAARLHGHVPQGSSTSGHGGAL
ncbi:MAG: hypothetical protein OXI26_00065 [bacterium]|nr:hypothetical protein [bacterium]